jgi:NodT family efflux transporter outer membrane factor (OMF) lipoprotein
MTPQTPPLFQPLRNAAACLCVAAGLLGCASSTAPGAAPAAAALPAWQAPLPHGGTATDLARWWGSFSDPVLPLLIDSAQRASPSLATAAARIERARANRVAAGVAALPLVEAVGSVQTGRLQPRQATATTASLGLQAAWEIDVFGGLAAGRDAAQARLEGAQAGWHDARVSLAAEVASSYVALRGCEAQLAQARLDAASREETSRLTELSARAGFTAPADAALARASAAQSRSLALARQAQCETSLKGLVELTALDEPALRERLAARTAVLPQPAPIAVQALPAALLAQRPDLAEAARNVVAAAGDRRNAEALERPQVRLSGSLAGAGLRSAGVSSSGSTWSLGPLVVSLPVFDGGLSAANSAAARADYDAAVAVYQAQVRRAVREVEAAFVALDSTARRQQDAEAAARDFEASLVATQARQRSGLASLFDLEAARRNAVQAQSALVELQAERATAWISLYRALGGGWSADPSGPVSAQAQP